MAFDVQATVSRQSLRSSISKQPTRKYGVHPRDYYTVLNCADQRDALPFLQRLNLRFCICASFINQVRFVYLRFDFFLCVFVYFVLVVASTSAVDWLLCRVYHVELCPVSHANGSRSFNNHEMSYSVLFRGSTTLRYNLLFYLLTYLLTFYYITIRFAKNSDKQTYLVMRVQHW